MKDVLEVLEDYLPQANPRKWARLSSDIEYRRLNLLLLGEVLCELRKVAQLLQKQRS